MKRIENRYYLVRSPFRISLFGGGTDYPEYYSQHPGAVLGLAIDKYIYLSALLLDSYQDYRYRLAYSRLETVWEKENIEHPLVKCALEYFKNSQPMDFSFQADLPASAGLGSSSTFSVGFVTLLNGILGSQGNAMDTAKLAIHLDRDLLQENVGVQDHLHAAHGGINIFKFHEDEIRRQRVEISKENRRALENSILLVFTGKKRSASSVVSEQLEKTASRGNDAALNEIYNMVGDAEKILEKGAASFLKDLGNLLTEYWALKKSLSTKVTSADMDLMYDKAMALGAYGGKLCGAGGGGFFAFLVPPECKPRFYKHFGRSNCVPISIDDDGAVPLYRR